MSRRSYLCFSTADKCARLAGMATRKEYVEFILSQLAPLGAELRCRAMMGEYVLYFREKVVGGVYDNRLLLKPVPAAHALLPGAELVSPYPGAKALLLVEQVEDAPFLCTLLRAIEPELPTPKPRRR